MLYLIGVGILGMTLLAGGLVPLVTVGTHNKRPRHSL